MYINIPSAFKGLNEIVLPSVDCVNEVKCSGVAGPYSLTIRYHRPLIKAPADKCDGCGEVFSLTHALDCRKGGLVIQHHNEMRDTIGDTASIMYKEVIREPVVQEANNACGVRDASPSLGKGPQIAKKKHEELPLTGDKLGLQERETLTILGNVGLGIFPTRRFGDWGVGESSAESTELPFERETCVLNTATACCRWMFTPLPKPENDKGGNESSSSMMREGAKA